MADPDEIPLSKEEQEYFDAMKDGNAPAEDETAGATTTADNANDIIPDDSADNSAETIEDHQPDSEVKENMDDDQQQLATPAGPEEPSNTNPAAISTDAPSASSSASTDASTAVPLAPLVIPKSDSTETPSQPSTPVISHQNQNQSQPAIQQQQQQQYPSQKQTTGGKRKRLPQDLVGQLEDRIAENPRADIEAWLSLIEEHKRKGKFDDARSVYERFFLVFPQAVSNL